MYKRLVFEDEEGVRIDKYLVTNIVFEGFSRSYIANLVLSNAIKVNSLPVIPSYVLKRGDVICLNLDDRGNELTFEESEIPVLYEDHDCFVIDKPAGVVVHRGEGRLYTSGTVVNYFLDKFEDVNLFPDKNRPGIVHRLDKDTSGVLLVSTNIKSYYFYVEQFKERLIKKKYRILVSGKLEHKQGIIDSPISRDPKNRKRMSICCGEGGKDARSDYKVLNEYHAFGRWFSFVDVDLKTGRTHQIRVHFRAIGHPVVGDNVYGDSSVNSLFAKEFGLNRQFLHAYSLRFKIFSTGLSKLVVSKLPSDLKAVLVTLEEQ